jgi:GNAT superfamily N-acetyltransferase
MYLFREAKTDELSSLPDVEHAAGMMYLQTPHANFAHGPNVTRNLDFSLYRAWVAVHEDEVVAFAVVRVFGEFAHLHELDVHPDHARRGIGRQLIETVGRWAHEQGCIKLTLTTFSDVPWNGPYYSRLGFAVVHEQALSSHLRKILDGEAAAGFPMKSRVAMEVSLQCQ